ncbi:MAG: oligopeptide ABC transporter ATP-binding protein, partial [Pseudomonadales bacterium]|nr:oligopeptide ABC transporter ATP-binding protein [Pseudomonadales bacterium]
PRHPYTKSLISAIPVPDPHLRVKREIITGDVPSPINPPPGCRFHPRCPRVMERCKLEAPLLRTIADHQVCCHLDDL